MPDGLEEIEEGLEVGTGLDEVHLMLVGAPCLVEGFHVLLLDRFGRRRLHLERIDRSTVLPYAEIKMRTGRSTR